MRGSNDSRLRRRLLVAITVTGLLLQVTGGPVAAVYVDACKSDQIWKNWTKLDRVNATQNISGALANVRVRALAPCTETGGVADQSFVPITIQYSGTDLNRGVQIGYSKCGKSGGCNGIPNDGKPHFWYTASDTGGGLASLADGWYKAPILGDEYRMKVEATTSGGNPVWQYCIKNVSKGEAYTCHFETRTWSNGLWAWWGTETNNTRTQNGVRSIDPDIYLRAQYKQSGTWYYRDGSTNVCNKSSKGTYPSYYRCLVLSLFDTNGDGLLNDNETLFSWTNDHP